MTSDFYSENSTWLSSESEEYNYTLNYSCIISSFQPTQNFTLPTSIDIIARVIQVIYGLALVILGALLNALVLYLFVRHKKLRTVSFTVAVQLALVNLLSSIGYGIPSIANHAAGSWILGINVCISSGYILYLLINVRILLIFVFTLDRFCFVFIPFCYPRHNGKVVFMMSMLSWFLAITFNAMNLPPILDCYGFREDTLLCSIRPFCSFTCTIFFYTFCMMFTFPAVITSLGMFVALYFKGRKIRKRDLITGVPASLITVQEWRAIKTFFVLFLAIFVVIIPPFILFLASEQLEQGSVVKAFCKLLAIDLLLVLVIIDPIILLKNPDVREVIRIRHFFQSCLKQRTPDNQRGNKETSSE